MYRPRQADQQFFSFLNLHQATNHTKRGGIAKRETIEGSPPLTCDACMRVDVRKVKSR